MLKELRTQHPRAELRFWADKHFGNQAKAIVHKYDELIPVDTIISGKLRRYHHLSLMQHILWPSLMWHNFIDGFKVLAGTVQSFGKLVAWRPDVIFTKGGFVCLPVGFAARVLRIPLVIHDSDAHPGLTNRILAKWATKIATGAPLEYYNYPADRSVYVGIPISEAFHPYSASEQHEAKKEWNVSLTKPLVVITGGGLGAKRLNNVVMQALPELSDTAVVLVAGAGHYEELKDTAPKNSPNFQLHAFVDKMPSLLGAADVVVTRAGATTILELAALAKPTVLVPNGTLTGGHQLKNAAVYSEAQVAIVLDEPTIAAEPSLLIKAIKSYLKDQKTTTAMTKRFHKFAKPNAAKDTAKLILSARRKV